MRQNYGAIPESCDVVVIGGGPAGSSAAILLAKEGLDVILIDKVKHPRPMVGESIIPQLWKFADHLGIKKKVEAEGFLVKSGGIITWDGVPRTVLFSDFGYKTKGLHIERDIYDELMLQHAVECGARVYQEVIGRGVDFTDKNAPVVTIDDRRYGNEITKKVKTKWVIDASGTSALLAGQLKSRNRIGDHGDRKYVALWGYYSDSRFAALADRKSHHHSELPNFAPVTMVTNYEEGWVWHIILRNNLTSVGIVMTTERTKGMTKKEQEAYFRDVVETKVLHIRDLLKPAKLIEGSLTYRPDYSYFNEAPCGENYFCVGDAAAFADPIFSQGVTAAMYESTIAAWALTNALRSPERKMQFLDMFRERLLGFYGFARLITLGHFGAQELDINLVKKTLAYVPHSDLELSLAAAYTSGRGDNLKRLADAVGIKDDFRLKCGVLENLDLRY